MALGGVSVVEQLAQAAVRNKRRRQREGGARAAGIAAHEHAPYGTKFEVICSSVHVTASSYSKQQPHRHVVRQIEAAIRPRPSMLNLVQETGNLFRRK